MTRFGHLERGALAALYLLWLAAWLVIGDQPSGLDPYHWDQAAGAAATGCVAFYVSRCTARPYPGLLVTQASFPLVRCELQTEVATARVVTGGALCRPGQPGRDRAEAAGADQLIRARPFRARSRNHHVALRRRRL